MDGVIAIHNLKTYESSVAVTTPLSAPPLDSLSALPSLAQCFFYALIPLYDVFITARCLCALREGLLRNIQPE